ncbi:hypothetical protein [Curtobacterium sp. RRHDQ10]|uniref:hypothetical protein n=1 Tax=Curtobacterium phyllosphaerae TaxID=3413379 RepID=UPI003BF29D89
MSLSRTARLTTAGVVVAVGLSCTLGAAAAAAAPTAPPSSPPASTVSVTVPAPVVRNIQTEPNGTQRMLGTAGTDRVEVLDGSSVVDAWPGGGGLFSIAVGAGYKDTSLTMVAVRTVDGAPVRSEPVALPRTLQVDDVTSNAVAFTPGRHTFSGVAQVGSTVSASDAAGVPVFSITVGASTERGVSGAWSAPADLDDAVHVLTFTQTATSGITTTIAGVVYTPADTGVGSAPSVRGVDRGIDGQFIVRGDADGQAVVLRGGEEIAAAPAGSSGAFALIVPEQYLGSDVQVVARSDAGDSAPALVTLAAATQNDDIAAPSIRDTVSMPDGSIMVTGTSQPGATWIMAGDRVVAGYGANGGFAYTIPAADTGEQLDMVTMQFNEISERVPLPRLLTVDGAATPTYTPGSVAFHGTAETGSTITASTADDELFSTAVPGARSTTVHGARSAVGSWSAEADLASSAGYDITFTQTTADGRTSVMSDVPYAATAADVAPVTATSPRIASEHRNELVVFAGRGEPGQEVTLDPGVPGLVPVSTEVQGNGDWSVQRYLGDGAYAFDIVQTDASGATTSAVRGFVVNQGVTEPFAVTSPGRGSEHRSQTATFAGTGAARSTVTLRVANFSSADVVTTVGDDGHWSVPRYLGDGPYRFDIVQANAAGVETGRVAGYVVNQPADVDRDFAVTAPVSGTTFAPNTVREFSGTGSARATITIDAGAGLASVRTVVGADGSWKVGRYLGNGPYTFAVTMTPVDGAPVTSAPIAVTPEA